MKQAQRLTHPGAFLFQVGALACRLLHALFQQELLHLPNDEQFSQSAAYRLIAGARRGERGVYAGGVRLHRRQQALVSFQPLPKLMPFLEDLLYSPFQTSNLNWQRLPVWRFEHCSRLSLASPCYLHWPTITYSIIE